MGLFDILFGNKEEEERLKNERQAEIERQRIAEEKRIAVEREKRLAENRRKEAERKAKIESENSKKYQILDFYLDCSHWRAQQEKLRATSLALPVKRVDVEEEEDTREKYKVNNLPKLILVDLNGKEIYRWKGITEPSEINEYLYNNGYAERPAMSNPSSDTNNKENIFQATDMKLASQFVVESMSNLGYEPYSDFSDDFAVAELQKQFSHYCLMVKSNLAMDAIGKADPFIIAFKQHIRNYISNASNKNNQAMKYLYEVSDTDLLVQQISMLSLHANTKHVQDINNLSQEEFHAAMNPENVSLAMGLYTYFTILVNDNLSADDFNELFVESWIKYYGNAQARIFMFRMRGNSWKNDFKGVLLDD